MTDTKAARPWRMNPKSHNNIEDANGKAVYLRANAFAPPLASSVDADAAQNLADVLTAVNAHNAMRGVVEAARAFAEHVRRDYLDNGPGCSGMCEAAENLRAALAAAEHSSPAEAEEEAR